MRTAKRNDDVDGFENASQRDSGLTALRRILLARAGSGLKQSSARTLAAPFVLADSGSLPEECALLGVATLGFHNAPRRRARTGRAAHASTMTTAIRSIDRSGPAVRAALAEVAPAELGLFEAEFQQALERACEQFDLAPAQVVLDRWWGIAMTRANRLSAQEQEQLERARSGRFHGLWERDEAGAWMQL